MTAGIGNGRIDTTPQNPDHRDDDASRVRTDPSPILITKLFVPPPRSGLVARPRLIEQLNEGLHRKLTLISAPAGFGKTTVVSEWLAASGRPAAWLSLDRADHDPTRFLTYLIAAVQTAAPGVGDALLGVLQAPQPPSADSILTALLNEIAPLPDDIILVLDDYHLVDSAAVDDALAFLIDHLPPRLHLVITTREDPRLPLARLRARGDMTEIRAADLRFTHDEAATFLNDVTGLHLPAADLSILESRTEGWIAGLQLAALSMRGRADVSGFVRAFAGDNRYIVDYLVEEVLRRQPERTRRFLLQTSILDRLSGPLCDAVTGGEEGKALLESLERGNLFVVPLDDTRHWYRYHHLFADVLRAHAMAEQPAGMATHHLRASDWFEANGLRADAIRHALAAPDIARAASLVELAATGMLGSSQEDTLNGWLQALPDDVVRQRPVLSVTWAFAAFSREGLDAADARLRDAERWLDMPGDAGKPEGKMVVVDEAAFRSLPGTIAVARAYRAGALGDVTGLVTHARRALDLLPESDDLWRGAAAAILGIGYWTGGTLEPAYRSFAEGKALFEQAGYPQFQFSGVHILADIRIAQGRLRDAERLYEQSLRLATEPGAPVWGSGDLYVGLAELRHEHNDLDAATRLLLQVRELGEHVGMPDTRHRSYVAMARIRWAQGDLDAALDLLDEAARQYVMGPDPQVRPIAALKAQAWVAQGRLAEAQSWVRERNLSVTDDLAYLREFEHITLARILIARHGPDRDGRSLDEAMGLLDRLLQAAEAGERMGSVIEILVTQAIAHEARGDLSQALVPLERALRLAEPEGYARVFIDLGAPMARLLTRAVALNIVSGYAGALLAACDTGTLPGDPAAPPPATLGLVEPLSPRELEVLHLIAEGFSNHEIAERLYLALSTVKGHNRVIFGKLDVQRRTEAVARARALDLL